MFVACCSKSFLHMTLLMHDRNFAALLNPMTFPEVSIAVPTASFTSIVSRCAIDTPSKNTTRTKVPDKARGEMIEGRDVRMHCMLRITCRNHVLQGPLLHIISCKGRDLLLSWWNMERVNHRRRMCNLPQSYCCITLTLYEPPE